MTAASERKATIVECFLPARWPKRSAVLATVQDEAFGGPKAPALTACARRTVSLYVGQVRLASAEEQNTRPRRLANLRTDLGNDPHDFQ